MSSVIIGVDESGMGCIAGPLVVSAAAFAIDTPIVETEYRGVRGVTKLRAGDSKKVKKPEHLAKLAGAIREQALAHATIMTPAAEIDRITLGEALAQSLRTAIARVMEKLAPRFPANEFEVYIDGELKVSLGSVPCQVHMVPEGDNRMWQIGAASILARLGCEETMRAIAGRYPEWGFEKNMGYPTAAHRKMLAEKGPTPEHRRATKSVQTVLPVKKGVLEGM